MPGIERRVITLAPEDIRFNKKGELVVNNERVQESLRLAGAEEGRMLDTAATEVEVSVKVKF